MALHLVPGLTHGSVGTYAGFISGSFMIGRFFSAWPWAVISDIYGRKFVLLFSTFSSAILMLAFGFASSFTWVIGIRFLTGLCTGTVIAARVSVTELAKGDLDLEAKGMGMVMSMFGFGMLIGPAIGGSFSEPVTNYDFDFGPFENMLTKYPFALPNIIGAILNTFTTMLIFFSVEETLPPEKLRSAKCIIPDAIQLVASIPKKVVSLVQSFRNIEYEQIVNTATILEEASDTDSETDEIEEDLKSIVALFGESADAIAMCTPSSRASLTAALHRPSTVARKSIVTLKRNSSASYVSATISSFMSDAHLRSLLNSYWIMTFASTAAAECFPLFAMAKLGGLGLEETAIGAIGSLSGLFFVICQYFIFTVSMKNLGLHKTMISSALLGVAPVVLIPGALLIKSETAVIIYLSVLNGIMSVAFSNWNAAITITQNRSVDPSARSKLNGLSSLGSSLARACGPIVAGVLVTASYTNEVVPAQFGAVLIYSLVAAVGYLAFSINSKLEEQE